VRETDSFRELRYQLLRLAGSEPDETTSYDGMVDFHWGFIDLAEIPDANSPAAARASAAEPSK